MRRELSLEEKLSNKQIFYENRTKKLASNFQKAEVIRNGERALKQGKYFNFQLKRLESRGEHALKMS